MTAIPITETEFQAQVVELAHFLGWNHLHVRRTIGRGRKWVTSTNRTGWPDLFMWHPRHGFIAAELKVGKNKPTDEQLEVLDELADAGAVALVVYPEDLDTLRLYLQGKADEALARVGNAGEVGGGTVSASPNAPRRTP